jgi:hypothetical protein
MENVHGHCAHCRALELRLEALEALVDQEREIADKRHRQTQAALRGIDQAAGDSAEEMRRDLERLFRLTGQRFVNPNAHAQYLCDLLAERVQQEEKDGAA